MKMKRIMTAGALGVLLAVGVHGLCSASLRDDYRDLVVKRQALENKRAEYVANIRDLKATQRKLTFELYQCVIKRGGDAWRDRLKAVQARSDALEEERIRLTKLRIDLDKVRKTLEARRAQIEKKHVRKTEGSPYETAFRKYMDDLETRYFAPIENDLFTGYSQFSSDIQKLIAFLKTSVQDCNAGKAPGPAVQP